MCRAPTEPGWGRGHVVNVDVLAPCEREASMEGEGGGREKPGSGPPVWAHPPGCSRVYDATVAFIGGS